MSKSKPLQIGITGGIGSGKSVVCKIFRTIGIPTYDADAAAKRLMTSKPSLIIAIKNLFGEDAYLASGELNRKHIAGKAFSNKDILAELNALVHPEVGLDYSDWSQQQTSPYVIKEAALLIESGSYKSLDKLINVSAPRALRIERIKARDTFRSEEEIHNIIDKQLPESRRIELSNYVIKNDMKSPLLAQVIHLDKEFRKMV